MDQPVPDHTSGTAVREPRALDETLMVYRLADEVASLRTEPAWLEGDRNSVALVKGADIRVLLTALRPGATLIEKNGEGPVTVLVLSGAVDLHLDGQRTSLTAGELAALEAGIPWTVEASDDASLLLTLGWVDRSGSDESA